jgi:S1-C subfamily serine protease/antitoxin component YwqK of YwqJK toxin-antitoxin module
MIVFFLNFTNVKPHKMKNLFYIQILFLLTTTNLFSQTEKVFYNSNWDVTNSSDYEYYILVDKSIKNDEYKTFYRSGEIKSKFYCSEFNFEDISKSKFFLKYYELAKDGTTLCEGNFEFGNKTGLWSYYYDSKKLKSEINYANDTLNGKTVHYYDNGNIKSVGDYLKGQKNGKWIYYTESDEKNYLESYQNGKRNGSYISYFDNKNVYQKGNLTDGFKDGNWITNYSDGSIKTITEYHNGSKNPTFHECNEYKKCKAIISNKFLKSEIQSNWIASDSTYYQYTNDGILASFSKEKNKEAFYINLNIPWKNYDDFSFEVTFKNTENLKLQYGISWNENEIENTSNQFLISNQGSYTIDNLEDNVYLTNKFEKSTLINSGIGAENVLKITKKEDSIYYSINGGLVETQKLITWEGSTFKIILLNDEKELNSSLIIKDFTFKDTETYESVENRLETGRFNWSGSGTGFYVNNDGFIATNYHVIQDAPEIWVLCKQNGIKKKFKATIFQTDKINDLAIIKITDSTFVPLPKLPYQFTNKTIAVGNEVFSLGYPIPDVMGETVKFTDGKISSLTGINDDVTKYQVTAPIQNGNSGGPLFDNSGNVVGIIESGLNKEKYNSENVNYAVKSMILKNIVDLVPFTSDKGKRIKTSSLSQVEKIKVLSDYVVMIQTF